MYTHIHNRNIHPYINLHIHIPELDLKYTRGCAYVVGLQGLSLRQAYQWVLAAVGDSVVRAGTWNRQAEGDTRQKAVGGRAGIEAGGQYDVFRPSLQVAPKFSPSPPSSAPKSSFGATAGSGCNIFAFLFPCGGPEKRSRQEEGQRVHYRK